MPKKGEVLYTSDFVNWFRQQNAEQRADTKLYSAERLELRKHHFWQWTPREEPPKLANVAAFSRPGPRQHEARRRELDGDLELRVRQRLVLAGRRAHVRVEHRRPGRLRLVDRPAAVARAPVSKTKYS